MAKALVSKELAVVGGNTMLGRELRELLKEAGMEKRIRLVSGGDDGRALTDDEGELVVMLPLNAQALSGVAAALLAGGEASSRKAAQLLRGTKTRIIDLTGALEENPEARLRAPIFEPKGHRVPAGTIQAIAHPASVALALLLTRLHSIEPIARSVTMILEPVSERGKSGIDELHQQTVKLMSFQGLDKAVFDAQVAFNLLPEYGEDAPVSLATIEQRIDRNLASLLAIGGAPHMPSLRVIQAPVFHGHSFSVWVEFEKIPALSGLASGLKSDTINVRNAGEEAPTNAGVAGQGGITVGSIQADRNNARAVWFWLVADNLRLSAENALGVVREVAG